MMRHRSQRSPRFPIRTRRLRTLGLALAALWVAPAAGAGNLPQNDGFKHGGVQTCAGAPCHGRTSKGEGNVLQNEYRTWTKRDPHSTTYQDLFNKDSKRIARNLGIGKAHEADLCLDCHADNTEKRGAKFDLEDGVGCEACHGGAENWLASHDSAKTHAENVAKGMYPTDDPVKRAELCLSCHVGGRDKFVTHRIMGAGHPRLSGFELQTFTRTQPAHYVVDDDYRARGKQAKASIQVWAIGQAIAVREQLDALIDPKTGRDGIWPELTLFDCHACHHAMSEDRWRPRSSTGLPPGVPRLNDASFLMFRHALAAVDPAGAKAFRQELRELHAATSKGQGDYIATAKKMRARVDAAVGKLAAWKVDEKGVRAVARSLIDEGASGEYLDLSGGEQAAMAIQALAYNLYQMGALKDQKLKAVLEQTNAIVDAVADHEDYSRGTVTASFSKLRNLIN